MNKKGSVLILTIFVVVIFLILGVAFISRSISEHNLAQKYLDSSRAFWAAEAGINRALNELRGDYNQCGTAVWAQSLSSLDGGYSVDVDCSNQDRIVTSLGFVPASGAHRAERTVEVTINNEIPLDFYDKAIYSAGDIDLNGTQYTIDGDVIYAGECDNPDNITGTVTNDPNINPLPFLNFVQLLAISQSQGNFYDAERISSGESYPDSFWYSPPTDPTDPTTGIPNVVYISEDLTLKGNVGIIGGFFVVAGDVITDPANTKDATINGNGQIEGAIYTRGVFRVNGGGGELNVNGAVWSGQESRLNGNAHVAYNEEYLLAIEALDIDVNAQVTSWREIVNPYVLSP